MILLCYSNTPKIRDYFEFKNNLFFTLCFLNINISVDIYAFESKCSILGLNVYLQGRIFFSIVMFDIYITIE